MAGLEVVSYGVASLALAWAGGRLLMHGQTILAMAPCVAWPLLTVALMIRGGAGAVAGLPSPAGSWAARGGS